MTIANVSTAFAFNQGTQNCYVEDVDQFNKPVFTSVGQGLQVIFPEVPVTTGSSITINTNGLINLAANITYRFDMHCEVVPKSGLDPSIETQQRAGFALYNTTTNLVMYPTFPINTSGSIYYTTTQAEDIIMLAYVPDGLPPNTLTQPQTWQYPQQIINASIGVQAISGEDL